MARIQGGEKGFFVLEALLLLCCLMIATSGILVAYRAVLVSERARTRTEAAFLAQNEIESYLSQQQQEAASIETTRDGVVYHIERTVEERAERKEAVAQVRWTILGREERLELRREVVEHDSKT